MATSQFAGSATHHTKNDPNGSVNLPKLLSQLTAASHLHRTRAQTHLASEIPTWQQNDITRLQDSLLPLLSGKRPWETTFGAVIASETCVTHTSDYHFNETLVPIAVRLINHSEPRVRHAVAGLIGTLAEHVGTSVWHSLAPDLLLNVKSNFSLDDQARLREASAVAKRELDDTAASAKTASAMLHETEGWRGLETMLLALARLTDGCGADILRTTSPDNILKEGSDLAEILSYVRRAGAHPNRFVREAGLKLLTAVCGASAHVRADDPESGLLPKLSKRSVSIIREGLQDNWSQVRFAASVAARTVLQGLNDEERHALYMDLLPRMCLNRHYVAEGVRNYSQDTWRDVVGSAGRAFLQKHVAVFVEFYEDQCRADNHAVREAACQSLSEAALRLEASAVRGLVGRITDGLIGGFKDESWPVRDHACRSLAAVIASFAPEVDKTGRLSEIADLFKAHLSDNIPSVRQNCADSLVRVGLAYEPDHTVLGLNCIADTCRSLLARIMAQTEQATTPGATTPGTTATADTQYGASTRLAGADAAHTDQVMYSCGSLAPRLRRGGGCSDHGLARPKEPWEEADGAVRVWRALALASVSSQAAHAHGGALLQDVIKAGIQGGQREFNGRSRFLATVMAAFSDAKEVLAQAEDNEIRDVIRIVDMAVKEGGATARGAAQSRRIARGAVGYQRFSALQREMDEEKTE